MSGVPAELTTATDFVQVRLALMRHLGGALEAVVFTRIQYRTQDESRAWVEHAGRRWWTITIADLATDMGASEKQIRRVLDVLTERGAIVRAHLKQNGPYDQRWSYSPVILDVPSRANEVPLQADQSPVGADVQAPSGANVDPPSGAILPLLQEGEEAAEGSTHPNHPFAVKALSTLQRERALPLQVPELVEAAYRLGDGDPWAGYQQVKQRTEAAITGAFNPAATLRSRLT